MASDNVINPDTDDQQDVNNLAPTMIENEYVFRSWADKPKLPKQVFMKGIPDGLDYLWPIKHLYIYNHIKMVDELCDNKSASKHMLTIRNENYEQVYVVATSKNRKPHRLWGFKYRLFDQNSHHVFTLYKFLTCFGTTLEAEILCPPGAQAAVIKQVYDNDAVSYKVNGQFTKGIIIDVRRAREDKIGEYVVLAKGNPIGKIAKRSERVDGAHKRAKHHKNHYNDTEFVRVDFADNTDVQDKLIVLALALLIRVIHFSNIKVY